MHGMPICSAPETPDWLPAIRTQLWKGTPAYSAPARNAATVLPKLDNSPHIR
jgi:hypothetical protein